MNEIAKFTKDHLPEAANLPSALIALFLKCGVPGTGGRGGGGKQLLDSVISLPLLKCGVPGTGETFITVGLSHLPPTVKVWCARNGGNIYNCWTQSSPSHC